MKFFKVYFSNGSCAYSMADSLECYILNNFDEKFFYINSRCEFSRDVTL